MLTWLFCYKKSEFERDMLLKEHEYLKKDQLPQLTHCVSLHIHYDTPLSLSFMTYVFLKPWFPTKSNLEL